MNTVALKDKEGDWASFIGLDIVALEPNKKVVKDVNLDERQFGIAVTSCGRPPR